MTFKSADGRNCVDIVGFFSPTAVNQVKKFMGDSTIGRWREGATKIKKAKMKTSILKCTHNSKKSCKNRCGVLFLAKRQSHNMIHEDLRLLDLLEEAYQKKHPCEKFAARFLCKFRSLYTNLRRSQAAVMALRCLDYVYVEYQFDTYKLCCCCLVLDIYNGVTE